MAKKMSRRDISVLLKKHKHGIKIDLGGGANPQPGFLNIDMRDLPQVDIVQDLEIQPWPLPDGCAELVMASHLLEHINPAKFGFIRFMDEIWRILKPGGQLMASFPYAGSPGYWQDPTHVNGITERTIAYFDPLEAGGHLYRIYKPMPWKIVYNSWSCVGNMEIVLEKRKPDPSYRMDPVKPHYGV